MFTFSFGSAFAAVATNTEANLIKQATDYAKAQLPEAVQKAIEVTVKNGANAYITKEAWDAAAADIIEALEDEMDVIEEGYLADATTISDAKWDDYDLAYAVNALYGSLGFDYISIASCLAADNHGYAVTAAKEQFKLDIDAIVAMYGKVDVAGLYSATTPKEGPTYYEQAVKALADNEEVLKTVFFDAKGDVQNAGTTVSDIATMSDNVEYFAEVGVTDAYGIGLTLTGVKAKLYEGTSVVEYYYVNGIATKTAEEAADATDAAKAAAAKAAAQAAYAKYLAENTADVEFSKDFAADWLLIVNYLADENEMDGVSVNDLYTSLTYDDGVKATVDRFAAAIESVEALEAYAAKCAAEKDAEGVLVRDAEDIQDIVDEYTLAVYKYAIGAGAAPSYEDARAEIYGLSIDFAADEFAFDQAAKKADLEDELDSIIDGYYDLEAAAVKAEYEKAYAAIDAAKKVAEFTAIEAALDKAVGKILEDSEVEALFASGAMYTELDKQADAVEAYLVYANSGVKTYADEYIKYSAGYLATQVRDYYIANNARTLAEMKALTGVVEAVVAGLPTNADLAAAEKAADDAIKALPAASKVESSDLDAFLNAFDLAKAYNKMVKAATGTAGTKAIAADKVNALKAAIQEDIQLAYAKADKTDKAAMKEVSAMVTAANKNCGATKLFATKFVNPTTNALAKIRAAEKAAVDKAIAAIPFTVTQADVAVVEAARALYDAFVAEYTDVDTARVPNNTDGYVSDDFARTALLRAEAALGLNAPEEVDPAYSVEALKITAKSSAKKGSITVKWTVEGDTSAVEGYEIWKSTKHSSGYKKMFTTTKLTYKNTKGLEKGTRYFYKVRAIAHTAEGEKVKSDFSNKARRIAK